jgi:hypothetical protein
MAPYSLLVGLILMFVMNVLTICSKVLPIICLSGILGSKIVKFSVLLLLLGTVCCVLFIIPVVILRTLNAKIEPLPPGIHVEHGGIGKLTIWSLCLVGVTAVVSVLSTIVL